MKDNKARCRRKDGKSSLMSISLFCSIFFHPALRVYISCAHTHTHSHSPLAGIYTLFGAVSYRLYGPLVFIFLRDRIALTKHTHASKHTHLYPYSLVKLTSRLRARKEDSRAMKRDRLCTYIGSFNGGFIFAPAEDV